jgi:hypothetical protein
MQSAVHYVVKYVWHDETKVLITAALFLGAAFAPCAVVYMLNLGLYTFGSRTG